MSTPEEREVLARVERRRRAAAGGRAKAAKRKAVAQWSTDNASNPSASSADPEQWNNSAKSIRGEVEMSRARDPEFGPGGGKEQAAIDAGIARIRALDPKDCLACQSRGGCWIHETVGVR
jgi:hypothetical protein